MTIVQCELCHREMEALTLHHLIPKQTTKRKKLAPSATISICSACHKQIHTFFSHARLVTELNSVEKLKSEPQMQKFLAWVSKQNPNKRIKVNRQ